MTGIDLLSSLEALCELRWLVVCDCPFVLLKHMQTIVSLAAHQKLRSVVHDRVRLMHDEHEHAEATPKKARPTCKSMAAFDERFRYPRAELVRIASLQAARQLPEDAVSLLCALDISARGDGISSLGA